MQHPVLEHLKIVLIANNQWDKLLFIMTNDIEVVSSKDFAYWKRENEKIKLYNGSNNLEAILENLNKFYHVKKLDLNEDQIKEVSFWKSFNLPETNEMAMAIELGELMKEFVENNSFAIEEFDALSIVQAFCKNLTPAMQYFVMRKILTIVLIAQYNLDDSKNFEQVISIVNDLRDGGKTPIALFNFYLNREKYACGDLEKVLNKHRKLKSFR